jgi:hypothetical protein
MGVWDGYQDFGAREEPLSFGRDGSVRGSLAVVFDEVGLIEDDARPWDTMKMLCIPGEDIVIYDHPTSDAGAGERGIARAYVTDHLRDEHAPLGRDRNGAHLASYGRWPGWSAV